MKITRIMIWAILTARNKAKMPTTAMTAIELWEQIPARICSIMSILVCSRIYPRVASERI